MLPARRQRLTCDDLVNRMKLHPKLPSRQDVELCIAALQIEDQREKDALRRFYDRQRADSPADKSLKWLFWCAVGLLLAAVWLLDVIRKAMP